MTHVLDFLTERFHEVFQFNTIAGFRCAILAYHEHIGGITVGSKPRVSALLSGIYNNRHPQQKYTFIWDVKQVIEFLTTLPYDCDLSLKDLTLKLTMFLALTPATKVSEICYLNIRYLIKHNSGYIFNFGKNTKTSKKEKPRSSIKFIPLDTNKNLCVCHHIDLYLEKTKEWHKTDPQLLLSFIGPHLGVSTLTISRWIITVLNLSGIDTRTFASDSTRSASSSKAKTSGVSTAEIIKRGYRSGSSTFENFCHKEILPEEVNFQLIIQKCFEERSKFVTIMTFTFARDMT